jgi:nucleoside-diphosphate-sugar epimerase
MARQANVVLITGGSGFIGANLARAMIREGRRVHLLLRPSHQSWRLAGIAGQYQAEIADLTDAPAMRNIIARVQPDDIYHLGTHGAYPNQTDRGQIVATNLQGTIHLIEALKDHDFRSFIHTGSSSEYGHKTEAMSIKDRLDPRTDYAITKAAATLMCQAEAFKNRPFSTVRVFSAYGPWEEPTRLVPYVMQAAASGQRPRVTSGAQPRDFIYVDDVIALITKVADTASLRQGIWNAGTGTQSTVQEMIETITQVCTGGSIHADFGSAQPRKDEPTAWIAESIQTIVQTGWQPKHTLESGVLELWNWYQTQSKQMAA